MSERDGWGRWIEHDGMGCPCIGEYIQAELQRGPGRWPNTPEIISTFGTIAIFEFIADNSPSWRWSNFGKRRRDGAKCAKVLRYRIRKPRGLAILEGILREVERKGVDA